MYMACKLNGAPRNAREIADLFGVDNGVIAKGCKILQSVVVNEVGTIETSQPTDYVKRFSSRLHMDDVEYKFASSIVEKALELEIVSDFMPSSVAAGALHMTNVELNVGIQRQQIARACFLSDSTVSKCYKRLQQYKPQLISYVKNPDEHKHSADAQQK
jgi:transcription initiation factor TFIIB